MADKDRKCYYPDGSEARNNVPCSGAEGAACCGSVDICLTNGLCLNTGHQPYLLSRGACTKKDWGYGCPNYCLSSIDAGRGVSMINLNYNSTTTATYCCGTPVSESGSVVCPLGEDSFEVEDGDIVFGRAALYNATAASGSESTAAPTSAGAGSTASSSPDDSSSCNNAAIGAGVGVPLGIIALLAIAWAIWERSRAKKQAAMPVHWSADPAKQDYPQAASQPVVEIGDTRQIHQIMDTERQTK